VSMQTMRYVGFLILLLPYDVSAQTCRTEMQIPSSTPTERFVENGDGTVTDNDTGLMWMKCSLGQSDPDCSGGSVAAYTWKEALDIADSYTFAGYSDWRIPNVKELRTIVEQRCYYPSVNLAIFPETPNSFYWTSSAADFDSSGPVWSVSFDHGFEAIAFTRVDPRKVRLVRNRSF